VRGEGCWCAASGASKRWMSRAKRADASRKGSERERRRRLVRSHRAQEKEVAGAPNNVSYKEEEMSLTRSFAGTLQTTSRPTAHLSRSPTTC
jgi:hypothetical protein